MGPRVLCSWLVCWVGGGHARIAFTGALAPRFRRSAPTAGACLLVQGVAVGTQRARARVPLDAHTAARHGAAAGKEACGGRARR